MLGTKQKKWWGITGCGCGGWWWVVVCVQCVKDHTAQKETEKMALDHSANMSTEIKLVYYFQRGKKITKQKSSHILH